MEEPSGGEDGIGEEEKGEEQRGVVEERDGGEERIVEGEQELGKEWLNCPILIKLSFGLSPPPHMGSHLCRS